MRTTKTTICTRGVYCQYCFLCAVSLAHVVLVPTPVGILFVTGVGEKTTPVVNHLGVYTTVNTCRIVCYAVSMAEIAATHSFTAQIAMY